MSLEDDKICNCQGNEIKISELAIQKSILSDTVIPCTMTNENGKIVTKTIGIADLPLFIGRYLVDNNLIETDESIQIDLPTDNRYAFRITSSLIKGNNLRIVAELPRPASEEYANTVWLTPEENKEDKSIVLKQYVCVQYENGLWDYKEIGDYTAGDIQIASSLIQRIKDLETRLQEYDNRFGCTYAYDNLTDTGEKTMIFTWDKSFLQVPNIYNK